MISIYDLRCHVWHCAPDRGAARSIDMCDETLAAMLDNNFSLPAQPPPRVVKQSIGDRRADFIRMIGKVAASPTAARSTEEAAKILATKESNATNGLETSTFIVATRIRPAFSELESGDENFECCLKAAAAEDDAAAEAAVVLLPKISLRGVPKLEKSSFAFDHTFSQQASNDEVFAAVGQPLVARALAGEVAVLFAYGQTGSGKTHTVGGVMDRVVGELFPSGTPPSAARHAHFSYLEILGNKVHGSIYYVCG